MSAQDAAVLRAARARLTPEGAWTQSEFARNADGRAVPVDSSEAVCWCLRGAFMADNHTTPLRVIDAMPRRWVVEWNDAPGRTQAEVLAFLDARIAEAEAAP